MRKFTKSVIPNIESVYTTLSNSEKIIADFFINDKNAEKDYSASNIARKLNVSEASLTRFSKKCGFNGYREFIYLYEVNLQDNEEPQGKLTNKVLSDYDEILNKIYSLIDEDQITNIIELFIKAKRVFFYGVGSSGLVAKEMKSRFMRLGLYCDAFTDPDLMQMNSALVNREDLIIALSLSSKTPAVHTALEQTHKKRAKSILFTANKSEDLAKVCDEIVLIPTRQNLNYGNRISPQFPLLVMLDIFYAYLLNSDAEYRNQVFSSTLLALDEDTRL